MKSNLLRALALLALLTFDNASAKVHLQFSDAWLRATPPNAQVAGGFIRIENTGDTADRLLSASSTVATSIEFHEMSMQGELMQMRELKDGIALPAQKIVTLQPSDMHMMLIEPKQRLIEGQKIRITLNFAKMGKYEIIFTVLKNAAPTERRWHE
jgi:copper(I)-binding protein